MQPRIINVALTACFVMLVVSTGHTELLGRREVTTIPPVNLTGDASATSSEELTQSNGGLKIYISVDMEGISGVSGRDQTSNSGTEYGRSRKLMAEDTNAAIRGAIAAGATEIVVNDSHGGQRNILPEDLHPSASLISHNFKRHGMVEGLDDTFDAAMFIGYHAKAGTPVGLFAHTGSGVVRNLEINGISVGEGGMNTMMADWHGVPVVLVTGDNVAVNEIQQVAKEARGVVVKHAINAQAVRLKSLAAVREDIERVAKEAVSAVQDKDPTRVSTYSVRLQFQNTLIPYVSEVLPSIRRPSPDTLEFSVDSMPDAYATIRFLYRWIRP